MNRMIKITTLLLGLMAATAASAQAPYNAQVLSPSSTTIDLSSSQGKLIRLPRPANAVFIADTKVADVSVRSPQLVYVFAKGLGETTLYALDSRDQLIVAQRVIIAPNLDRVKEIFHKLQPNAPVQVSSIGNQLLLTGTVDTAAASDQMVSVAVAAVGGDAKKVINQITVASPNQVNIRVKIAEVSRDINKKIGFHWELLGQATTDWVLGFGVGGDIVRTAANGFILDDTQNHVVSSFSNGSVSVDNVLDLLDDEGLITLLAEPNLTAMSGETASFLAGGEFPIPVAQSDGVTSITYRNYGVGLSFTPTIVGRNRINLKVRPEVSQLSSAGSIQANGFDIPSLTTRRADTTVELGSGQSFAIAGLLQNSTNQALSDVPGIKEIPILGALFRSDAFRRQESELMIIVTPFIVRPVSARLPLPTDNYQPPKDLERFLLGQTHVQQPAPKASAPLDPYGRPGVSGAAGFVLQ
jgi:pilus assembly protein CpaC